MKLKNPFPERIRFFYVFITKCLLCRSNGVNKGGLELHHILGRSSASMFNCAMLCGDCHRGMVHSDEEHKKLFSLQLKFLHEEGYRPTIEDYNLLRDNWNTLYSVELKNLWII